MSHPEFYGHSVSNTVFNRLLLPIITLIASLLKSSILVVGILSMAPRVYGASCDEETFSSEKAEIPQEVTIQDPDTYEYQGLTDYGLEALREVRDAIRSRYKLFEQEFRNLSTNHHAKTLTRMFRGNMFFLGPGGGAKTAMVKWFLSGEAKADPSFQLQLHQMITEQALIGGQDFEAAKRGEFKIITKGSMADHVVALLDEAHLANPAALVALQSLLNIGEREVMAAGQLIKAKTQAVYATSNASFPEMQEYFQEVGQGPTAPPFFSRFQFKSFVYNWLSLTDQAVLDERIQRRRYLKSLAETNPEVLKDEIFLEPENVDWEVARRLANRMFKCSPLFMTVFRQVADKMRSENIKAIRRSEQLHRDKPQEETFVYFPSADLNERTRGVLPEIVLMSAFIDFLNSPMADDSNLEQFIHRQIILGPLSLWRLFIVMTTIGPGDTRFIIDDEGQQKIGINYTHSIDPNSARDQREEKLVKNLISEQSRYSEIFLKHIEEIQGAIKTGSRFLKGIHDEEKDVFELLLLRHQGK